MVCELVPTNVSGKAKTIRLRSLLAHDNISQILKIDLVHNAGHGRDNAEVVEGFLSPFQELIAFAIALEFHLSVALQRIGCGEEINLHRVVDDQVHRHHRVDLLGVAAQAGNGRTHGCQIDDSGHAGKVLHDHTRGQEGDAGAFTFRRPGCDILHIILGNLAIITLTQRCLEHDADRKRQPFEVGQTRFFQRIQSVDSVGPVFCF